ncbi:hypothetical protein Q4I30_006999 [Leishmania utingensis]|uniref:Uncharacterized protein n=1 Tax=Leishmania utingensis TaxID=653362 RepID=A0AAW2ZY57_9TRYP
MPALAARHNAFFPFTATTLTNDLPPTTDTEFTVVPALETPESAINLETQGQVRTVGAAVSNASPAKPYKSNDNNGDDD